MVTARKLGFIAHRGWLVLLIILGAQVVFLVASVDSTDVAFATAYFLLFNLNTSPRNCLSSHE